MLLLQNQIIADAAQVILLVELIQEQERRYPMLKLIRKIRMHIEWLLEGQAPGDYYFVMTGIM